MALTSYEDAHRAWKQEVEHFEIPAHDEAMMAESWNNFTDRLCKDGEFTNLQYHFCPAWDDSMLVDDLEHVLEGLGWSIGSTGSQTHIEGKGGDVYAYPLEIKGGLEFTIYLANPEAGLTDVAAAFLAMAENEIAENILGRDVFNDLDELVLQFY